jgi:hypothetical protein
MTPSATVAGFDVVCSDGTVLGTIQDGAQGPAGPAGPQGPQGEPGEGGGGIGGTSCTVSESVDGLYITVNCGANNSANLAKALCGTEAYNPATAFCYDGLILASSVYGVCNAVIYNVNEYEGLICVPGEDGIKGLKNERVVDYCGAIPFLWDNSFCLGGTNIEKRCKTTSYIAPDTKDSENGTYTAAQFCGWTGSSGSYTEAIEERTTARQCTWTTASSYEAYGVAKWTGNTATTGTSTTGTFSYCDLVSGELKNSVLCSPMASTTQYRTDYFHCLFENVGDANKKLFDRTVYGDCSGAPYLIAGDLKCIGGILVDKGTTQIDCSVEAEAGFKGGSGLADPTANQFCKRGGGVGTKASCGLGTGEVLYEWDVKFCVNPGFSTAGASTGGWQAVLASAGTPGTGTVTGNVKYRCGAVAEGSTTIANSWSAGTVASAGVWDPDVTFCMNLGGQNTTTGNTTTEGQFIIVPLCNGSVFGNGAVCVIENTSTAAGSPAEGTTTPVATCKGSETLGWAGTIASGGEWTIASGSAWEGNECTISDWGP